MQITDVTSTPCITVFVLNLAFMEKVLILNALTSPLAHRHGFQSKLSYRICCGAKQLWDDAPPSDGHVRLTKLAFHVEVDWELLEIVSKDEGAHFFLFGSPPLPSVPCPM